jgi:PST family polysaccharide transporter
VYFFAQSLVVQIVRVITLNLGGVLLPALNRLADDPQRQALAFLRAARALMLIGAPLCIGLGAIGPLFVRVFLDAEKWHDLPPVLAVLAGGVVFRLLDEPTNSLIAAQGRFRVGFRLSLIAGVSYAVICFLGASTGTAIGTAIAVALFFSCAGPAMLFVAMRNSGGTLAVAIQVFAIPAVLACVAILPWLLLDGLVPGAGRAHDTWVLIGTVSGASLSYFALACVLRPPGWLELLERLQIMMPPRLRPMVAYLVGGS